MRGAVPVELGREEAAAAARAELAKPVYQRDRPGLVERVTGWLLDRLQDLYERVAGVAPGGWVGVAVLVAVVALVVVAVRLGAGSLRGARSREAALFAGAARSAAEHRAAADAHAARGAWAEAVRERLRAVVRELEERGLLEERPGRTADEAARAGGVALPSCAAALAAGATSFDDVWYGGRPATEATDAALRELDAAVRGARPAGVPAPVRPS